MAGHKEEKRKQKPFQRFKSSRADNAAVLAEMVALTTQQQHMYEFDLLRYAIGNSMRKVIPLAVLYGWPLDALSGFSAEGAEACAGCAPPSDG